MTPRTKIRSLLRDMSDSDSDATRSPTQPKRGPREPSLQPALLQDQCSETKEKRPEAESEDDEEDNLPVAPKGRIAARMRAQESLTKLASSGSDEDAEHEGGETAYERIKRQLAAERKISIPEKGSEKPTSDEQASDAVVPKPIRRRFLLTKKQRAGVDDNTPPQSGQSSPPGSPDVSIAAEDGEQSAPLPIKKKFLFKKKQTQASEETRASSISRKSSPGLFVSPRRPSPSKEAATDASEAGHESDSEAPANPKVSSAFLALVEKKRKEREAKEAAEKKDKAEKAARLKSLHSSLMHSSEDETDQDAAGNKMTQQSRPTRKASKRALEEMNRETQRMSRNMQLAHQARTKKKITKESFFARFNLGQTVPTANASSPTTKGDNTSATASSVSPSDAEGGQTRDTPPTSPLAPDEAKKPTLLEGFPILEADEVVMHETEELPSLMELLTRPTPTVTPPVHKGKGKAQKGEPVKEGEFPMEDAVKPKRQIRVKLPSPKTSRNRQPNDSDDDLEILGSASMKKSRALALLDRVPSKRTKEDRALLMLRSLAHLTSHERQGPQNKSSMSSGEMQASLRQKARQQAAQERAEKIQQLKDRGIIVQTAEERERDQREVEDLIEKGRREAAEIGKKEKEAAKRAGEGGLGDTDDDDEDYAGSEGEDDIVGSEDEDTEDDEGGNQDEDGNDELGLGDVDGLVEKEAVEDDSEKDPEDSEDEANDFIDDIEDEPIEEIMSRKPRVARVISDDEEDEADPYERKPLSTLAVPPRFVMPGLPPSDDLALGLTQAFAATMADSQSQSEPAETQEQDSFAILRNMPEPDFPSLKILEADSQEVIRDSQVQESFNADDVVLDFTQTPARQSVPESPLIGISTQQSMPDPTQDVGFVMSPLLARRGPSSTVETVLLGNPEGSPAMKKKGRLMRRADAVPDASIPDDSQSQLAEGGFEIDPSAFDALRKGAKKVATKETFDKTRSNAKEMIEEVAEESEDEYAGLGGASDESAGEEDEEDRKMINDDGKEKVEEQKLAALYAFVPSINNPNKLDGHLTH
jgi:mediator of replication checkpoint protein 1